MKNIVIIIPSLQFWWGAEKVASILGTKLHEDWYHISYLTFYDSKEKYPFKWSYYTLNEEQTSSFFDKIKKLFTRAFKIKKFCKEHKIETIISLMEDANFPNILSKLFWNNAKTIISIRHSISDYKSSGYFRLIKILYKYANLIITLTNFEKENLIKNFNIKKENVYVIPNAINLKNIGGQQHIIPENYAFLFTEWKFTFITIWRLTKIKNQKLMIKAFNKLNEKYPYIQLLILWDWELKFELNQISNKNVHFLWNQSNVYPFLLNSDCFLLSSISEAFPNVILEAMACNLPIISTQTQWSTHILCPDNEYGINVESNNQEMFYRAMKRIVSDGKFSKYYSLKSMQRIKHFNRSRIINLRKKAIT